MTKPVVVSQNGDRQFYAEIVPMLFGKYRIIVTDGYIVLNGW